MCFHPQLQQTVAFDENGEELKQDQAGNIIPPKRKLNFDEKSLGNCNTEDLMGMAETHAPANANIDWNVTSAFEDYIDEDKEGMTRFLPAKSKSPSASP